MTTTSPRSGTTLGVRAGHAGRVAGLVTVVVSALWALTGVGTIVLGLISWGEGSTLGGWWGGWLELLGAAIAAIGVAVVIAAAVGILLAIRLLREQGRVGPAVFFGLIGAVSSVVLLLDLVGKNGPEPWALALLLNAAACAVVTILAIRAETTRG